MQLTTKQEDVTLSVLDACARLGLYASLDLAAFRVRNCAELVAAAERTCPLDPGNYGTRLLTFLARLAGNLEDLGYVPRVRLRLLCARKETADGIQPWTWGDWCDHLARRV